MLVVNDVALPVVRKILPDIMLIIGRVCLAKIWGQQDISLVHAVASL